MVTLKLTLSALITFIIKYTSLSYVFTSPHTLSLYQNFWVDCFATYTHLFPLTLLHLWFIIFKKFLIFCHICLLSSTLRTTVSFAWFISLKRAGINNCNFLGKLETKFLFLKIKSRTIRFWISVIFFIWNNFLTKCHLLHIW